MSDQQRLRDAALWLRTLGSDIEYEFSTVVDPYPAGPDLWWSDSPDSDPAEFYANRGHIEHRVNTLVGDLKGYADRLESQADEVEQQPDE